MSDDRLCCPWCGSLRLTTVEKIEGLSDVTVYADGEVEFGETQIIWDGAETTGIHCRDCDWEMAMPASQRSEDASVASESIAETIQAILHPRVTWGWARLDVGPPVSCYLRVDELGHPERWNGAVRPLIPAMLLDQILGPIGATSWPLPANGIERGLPCVQVTTDVATSDARHETYPVRSIDGIQCVDLTEAGWTFEGGLA